MHNKEQMSRHRIFSGATGALIRAVLAGLIGAGQSTPVAAQTPKMPEFRVGNLIESGAFGEPKGWTLKGFVVEGKQNISRKGQSGGWGTASTPFLGPDGFYKIRVLYQDEGDGVSRAMLAVGGRTIGAWSFDGILVSANRWKEFDGVEINKGDEIVLSGRSGGYEYSRIYGMEILPSKPLATAAEASAVEKKEYSMNLVPISGLQAQKTPDFLLSPGPAFSGSVGTYWVYLQKGVPFRMEAWPSGTGIAPSVQYSLTKAGSDEPVAAETIVSEDNVPIYINLRNVEDGLYELKVEQAPETDQQQRPLLKFDVPVVSAPGANEGYFFVPKGTKAFSVKTGGHTVILDASGKVVVDEWFDKDATRVISVPAGSDNQTWYFQGPLSNLVGVPPYVAVRREAMLVPKEALQ